MKRFSLSAFLTITTLSVAGLVSHSAAQQGPSATPQAGFMQGGAKTGAGLQVDCVRPITQGGTFQRPKASKALPQVDQQIVAACKASNPNFGKVNPKRAGKAEQTAPQ
jgi:hypothetical protein